MKEWSTKTSHLLFILTLVVFVAIDLYTKKLAFSLLADDYEHVVWEGVFKFELTTNSGMMWGMARTVPAKWWVLIRGSVLIGLIFLYFTTKIRSRLVPFAFGLVAAGAIGNIHDNIFEGLHHGEGLFEGSVRDFLRFYLIDFPTFNVADACICVGAPLLLIVLWRQDREAAIALERSVARR